MDDESWNPCVPGESVLKKMLMDLDDGFISSEITQFLENKLDLSEFESQKRLFFRIGKLPFDQVTIHMKKAHDLINFWKNLYLYSTLKFEELRCCSSDGFEAADTNESDGSDQIGWERIGMTVLDDGQCSVDGDFDNADGNDFKTTIETMIEKNIGNTRAKAPNIAALKVDLDEITNGNGISDTYIDSDEDEDVAENVAENVAESANYVSSTRQREASRIRPNRRVKKQQDLVTARAGDALKAFNCRLCGEMLLSFNHMISHGKEFLNACPICEENDLDDVLYHLKVTHFGKTPYQCENCPHISFSEEERDRHAKKHSILKQFQCKKCRKWYPDQESHDRHYESQHVNVAPKKPSESDFVKRIESATCEICGVSFSGQRCGLSKKLDYHRKTKHLPHDKFYKCRICDKSFVSKGALTRHCITHSDKRPYLCAYDNCGKRFKCPANLKQHETFHNPKKHGCQRCGEKFFLRSMLKDHLPKCTS